jgi:hypothetical protein
MALTQIKPGDKFPLTAEWYNATLAAIDRTRVSGGTGNDGISGSYPNAVSLNVLNDTGEDLAEFSAVVIDAPVVLPADDENTFRNNPWWTVKKAVDVRPWGILRAPVKEDRAGELVVIGDTCCKINLVDVGHKFVEIEANSYIPKSGASGSAMIVWVAGGAGTASATGEQWAFIKIGGGSASLPEGQYAEQAYKMVANNQSGWDFIRSHGLL